MKAHIRTIGIDDAAFQRSKSSKTFVFGVVVRDYSLIEGILRTEVEIDGLDATSKIAEMILHSRFQDQLKAIILGSSTIAAFNVIDLSLLNKKTKIPIINILNQLPDDKEVKKALSHLSDWELRYKILTNNPPIQNIEFENQIGNKYKTNIQQVGFSGLKEVKNILKITSFSSSIPECLRIADLIGQSFKTFTM